jgi:hypothetical protein
MVDLNGHEAGNGGYSQRKPTAHRVSSTRKNRFPAGVRSNLQGPREISVDTQMPEEGTGLAHELAGAMKKG